MENVIIRAVTLAQDTILQPTNFPELVKNDASSTNGLSNIANIVDQIMKGNLSWDNLKANYGAKGPIRKEVLITLQKRWEQDRKRRLSAKELAELLHTSYNNMRRILSEYKIKI